MMERLTDVRLGASIETTDNVHTGGFETVTEFAAWWNAHAEPLGLPALSVIPGAEGCDELDEASRRTGSAEVPLEEAARHLLESLGVPDVQSLNTGAVLELANLVGLRRRITREDVQEIRNAADLADGKNPPAVRIHRLRSFADALEPHISPERS